MNRRGSEGGSALGLRVIEALLRHSRLKNRWPQFSEPSKRRKAQRISSYLPLNTAGFCPISANSRGQKQDSFFFLPNEAVALLLAALPGVLMQKPDKPLVLCDRASLSLKTVPNSLRLKSPDCMQPRWTRRKLSPTWVWPVQDWERTL